MTNLTSIFKVLLLSFLFTACEVDSNKTQSEDELVLKLAREEQTRIDRLLKAYNEFQREYKLDLQIITADLNNNKNRLNDLEIKISAQSNKRKTLNQQIRRKEKNLDEFSAVEDMTQKQKEKQQALDQVTIEITKLELQQSQIPDKEALKTQIEAKKKEKQTLGFEIAQLKRDIETVNNLSAEITQLKAEINEIDSQISLFQDEVIKIQGQDENLEDKLESLYKTMRKKGLNVLVVCRCSNSTKPIVISFGADRDLALQTAQLDCGSDLGQCEESNLN